MSDPRSPQALSAGRVGRPHGLDGGFYVIGAQPRLLEPEMSVTVGGHTHEIVRRAGIEQRPIIHLRGVRDRNGAEALRGLELRVALDEAPPLEPDEWWAHELQGCEVYSTAHEHVGTVTALLQFPSCEILQVARLDGGELHVPMVKDAIRQVDAAAHRIEIDLQFLGETPEDPRGSSTTEGSRETSSPESQVREH